MWIVIPQKIILCPGAAALLKSILKKPNADVVKENSKKSHYYWMEDGTSWQLNVLIIIFVGINNFPDIMVYVF